MCGIVGFIGKNSSISELEFADIMNSLTHRGPDNYGILKEGHIYLGHRRLSIIDLEGGKQPLSTQNGEFSITFNGEIYNYIDIRKQLEHLGHIFHTNSDTEVLLYAYSEWGSNLLEKLRGMFAFAIVDKSKQELFIARDQFGIKPFVYYQDESCFAFASEIQALRQLPGFKADLDLAAIDQFLLFKYITAPNTAYKRVKKLPPAHFMRVGFNGQIKELTRYWQLAFRPDYKPTEEEWLERLEFTIKDSVKSHLVSDVPFGAFLSGGIDSSLVVGYMAQQMQQPVKTFCIGFQEAEFNETSYARQVAHRWHTEHHEEIVLPDAISLLPELVKHYGEPFGDVSAIPTWYVSKLARQHVTMALSGDAGDELFAGYESYTHGWARQVTPVPHHLPAIKKIGYRVAGMLAPGKFPMRKAGFTDWLRFNSAAIGNPSPLWHPELATEIGYGYTNVIEKTFDDYATVGHFQMAQGVDFAHYLPGDVLKKVDIASMMHSLEVRTPLLDIKVAELAVTIPQQFNIRKINGCYEGKLLLKKLLGKYMPDTFVNRPKKGFAVPMDNWLDGKNVQSQQVYERLRDKGSLLHNLIQPGQIELSLKHHRKEFIWKLLFLDEWLNQQ